MARVEDVSVDVFPCCMTARTIDKGKIFPENEQRIHDS